MITSDDAPSVAGELLVELAIRTGGRFGARDLPLEERPNWYAESFRVPGAPRPTRTPVEGQEILR